MDRNTHIQHSEAEWDAAIERSLVRDAEALPSFTTEPNAQLATQLAASHSSATGGATSAGFFYSTGGKVAVLAGGTLVAAIAIVVAIYFIPSRDGHPYFPQKPTATPSVVTPKQPASTMSVSPRVHTPLAEEQHTPAIPSKAPLPQARPASRPALLLDEDETPGPTLVDSMYRLPLR